MQSVGAPIGIRKGLGMATSKQVPIEWQLTERFQQLQEISILADAFPKIRGDDKNINITNKVLTPILDRILALLNDNESEIKE